MDRQDSSVIVDNNKTLSLTGKRVAKVQICAPLLKPVCQILKDSGGPAQLSTMAYNGDTDPDQPLCLFNPVFQNLGCDSLLSEIIPSG
jgi:hypothetical protein